MGEANDKQLEPDLILTNFDKATINAVNTSSHVK